MDIQKPNIFRLATSELSQDTIIAWLLQWSNPKLKEVNPDLHSCGMALLRLLIQTHLGTQSSAISTVEAGRQWENIDIWAEIQFENNDKLLLIIEDKTYSAEHSNQLLRYKEIAQKWCTENGFKLSCAYIKIGSEPLKVLNAISDKGFEVFDRRKILSCLKDHLHVDDSFVIDYIEHIQHLEDAHDTYSLLPPKDWNGWSWVGLYQFIESQIKINTWHWVNNPSGGFWNLCLNWGYWGAFPVYMQIEQGKLCYKIALSEDETGYDSKTINADAVQNFVHGQLLEFSKNDGVVVNRPHPYVHRGSYRTIGVVDQDAWLGVSSQTIDKSAVIDNVNKQMAFYNRFLKHLNTITYAGAGLTMLE